MLRTQKKELRTACLQVTKSESDYCLAFVVLTPNDDCENLTSQGMIGLVQVVPHKGWVALKWSVNNYGIMLHRENTYRYLTKIL